MNQINHKKSQKNRIKKNDTVLLVSGKDSGKTGKINSVLPKLNKAIVAGVNIFKKNAKPSKKYPKGGIIDIQHPIHLSNLRLICPHCQKITKAKVRFEKNQKQRLCHKCRKNIDIEPTKTNKK